MLDTTLKPAALQIDHLDAENAIEDVEKCANTLYALIYSSGELADDARNSVLDLIGVNLKKLSDDLRSFLSDTLETFCAMKETQEQLRRELSEYPTSLLRGTALTQPDGHQFGDFGV
jgi:hypothetical protein